MESLARYLNTDAAAELLRRSAAELGVTEFAAIRNLDYVLPPVELVPLAPRVSPPLPRIAAFAVDMDGTSTTTEPLALHALEYMVRRITGRMGKAAWAGLDERRDYPHVIGNSNFRHTEFLVERYRPCIDQAAFAQAFCEAIAWTQAVQPDRERVRAVALNAGNCGLRELVRERAFLELTGSGTLTVDNVGERVRPLVERFGPAFRPAHDGALVAAALDIYYMRYHAILQQLEHHGGQRLARELLGENAGPFVAAMPGYDVFLPLVKGWLGDEIDALYEPLREQLLKQTHVRHTRRELDALRPRLKRLAAHFRASPAKVALVTASIQYEAHACMRAVFAVLAERVQSWPVPAACRDTLLERLADYRAVFDGFVTASDACEPRLKPHRDLYSLALFQMAVPKGDCRYCVGLEDTEPGIIALRAAGIGCAVALPNHDTSRQNYAAATETITGGLPELILVRNCLLEEMPATASERRRRSKR